MKIIIAGGGTGGHLFPGIALAQTAQLNRPINQQLQIIFLCTERPFDTRELTRYKFDYKILPSPRLSLSPKFVIKFIKSLVIAYQAMTKLRPDYVIGLGGYGSFPSLIIAKMLNIPIILLEQNLLPGKVNRIFSAWAKLVLCQWQGSKKYLANPLRARIIGSPIRIEIKRIARDEACKKLGVDPGKKILAILGGSQGAEAINRLIVENINILIPRKNQITIIQLTGEADYQKVKAIYESSGINHYVAAFSREMSEIYSCADLVIARAGGITIAELTALGIPAVLIPYPHAAENHQYLNAREFARYGAGLLIEQKELNTDKLRYIIEDILFNRAALTQMAQSSQKLGFPQSGQEIVSLLIN